MKRIRLHPDFINQKVTFVQQGYTIETATLRLADMWRLNEKVPQMFIIEDIEVPKKSTESKKSNGNPSESE